MSCNEIYYELIGAIGVYPDCEVTFARPFNVERKSDVPDFTFTGCDLIRIPMKRKSGSLKETHSIAVTGESYEVVVEWEVENVTPGIYNILEDLKNGTNHLIIKSFPNGLMFVRSIPGAHSFEYSENNGVLKCKFTIRNVTGAQRIMEG